jgi:hypothetical protein
MLRIVKLLRSKVVIGSERSKNEGCRTKFSDTTITFGDARYEKISTVIFEVDFSERYSDHVRQCQT